MLLASPIKNWQGSHLFFLFLDNIWFDLFLFLYRMINTDFLKVSTSSEMAKEQRRLKSIGFTHCITLLIQTLAFHNYDFRKYLVCFTPVFFSIVTVCARAQELCPGLTFGQGQALLCAALGLGMREAVRPHVVRPQWGWRKMDCVNSMALDHEFTGSSLWKIKEAHIFQVLQVHWL